MKRYLADLHIHTALSPCALEEMTPPGIVRAALHKGLAIIAICDHNTAGNTAAVAAAAGADITVIAGIEITTSEDVHVLGLFPNSGIAIAVGDKIKKSLPEIRDPSDQFGQQSFMNSAGGILGTEKRMLAASSGYKLSDSIDLIRNCNGLVIAAHVDRPSFSVISQLGMLPEGLCFDGVEISAAAVKRSRIEEFKTLGSPVITSSDSHFLSDIGICCTALEILAPTFSELALALKGSCGRRCSIA